MTHENLLTEDIKSRAPLPPPSPPSPPKANSSASTLQAADAWNEEGRLCLRMATLETSRGEYVDALYHQRNAQVAFAHEIELRKLLNS